MDRFEAMQAFVRVAGTGSFTKAADALGTSRTRVTQLVQQLEAHLRVKLLNLTTRKVALTADGEAFHERAVRLLADLDDAETSLSDASTSPRGQLRVDVPSALARVILIPALPGFVARYPDIQIDLGASDRMVDMLGEQVDCVVQGGEPTQGSMVARRIADLGLCVCASPGYLERFGVPGHPDELAEPPHRVVGFMSARTRRVLPATLRRDDEVVQVQGRTHLTVDDGNAYVAAGVADMGALWLPEYMARPHVDRGELVRLFPGWQLDPMPLYLAYPPNRHVSLKLRVFIDWVVALLRGLEGREAPSG